MNRSRRRELRAASAGPHDEADTTRASEAAVTAPPRRQERSDGERSNRKPCDRQRSDGQRCARERCRSGAPAMGTQRAPAIHT